MDDDKTRSHFLIHGSEFSFKKSACFFQSCFVQISQENPFHLRAGKKKKQQTILCRPCDLSVWPRHGVCLRTSGWPRCDSGFCAFRRRSSPCRCACAAAPTTTTRRGAWWPRWMASYDGSTIVALAKFCLRTFWFFYVVIPPQNFLLIQCVYLDLLFLYIQYFRCISIHDIVYIPYFLPGSYQVVIVFGLSTSMVMPLQRLA